MEPEAKHTERPWVVLKYGGTSVSSLANWKRIRDTIQARLRARKCVMVVCSALSQVSNRLEILLETVASGASVEAELRRLEAVHLELAAAMDLDAEQVLGEPLGHLRDTLEGIRLTREVTPRLRARVLSVGERLTTRLGHAWLRRQGLPVSWQDACTMLTARPEPDTTPDHQYLSARCLYDRDPALEARLRMLLEPVVLTQGFVAALPDGDTVLLGRGGSDTAAAYLAAKLGAERLEIWTDVAGMYSADPRDVPGARLLGALGYEEAEELAAKGAKVLHPRCIRPAQELGIPIHIYSTAEPQRAGTVISSAVETAPGVRAVAKRRGLILVSMQVEAERGEIGTIADLTRCFKDRSLSIDLLASSPTNLTVAIDPLVSPLDDETIEALLAGLGQSCTPRLIQPTASVSLVGTGIRQILHEWAGMLAVFEDEPVYLVAQAANDLSLTLVVNESSACRLERELHDRLFGSPVAASTDLSLTR